MKYKHLQPGDTFKISDGFGGSEYFVLNQNYQPLEINIYPNHYFEDDAEVTRVSIEDILPYDSLGRPVYGSESY